MRYVNAAETRNYLKISAMTLKRWKDAGKISYKKLSIRKYLYDVDSVFIGAENKTLHDHFNVVYPCVSNIKQLEQQLKHPTNDNDINSL